MRSNEEIKKKIKELAVEENFCTDNYGSEAADNGEYQVSFSESATSTTLENFAKWLISNEEEKI